MNQTLTHADIYAMFERAGVDPIERDREELRDQLQKRDAGYDNGVTYRTILTNGTGKSMRGGTDAELESNAC